MDKPPAPKPSEAGSKEQRQKKGQLSFWYAYRWFFGVALILFLLAMLFYSLADERPKQMDNEISSVVQAMDGKTDRQQRELILDALIQARNENLGRLMWEHLAEALMLAGIMIATVEGITRYMSGKEVAENSLAISNEIRSQADRVSENVWNAIFQRLVPHQIATEVKGILKSDVCRIRPEYTVILTSGDYTDVPLGCIVTKRQLYYRLFNLTGDQFEHTIPLRTYDPMGDRELTASDGQKVKLPRISKLVVNKTDVPISPAQRTSLDHVVTLPRMETESEAVEVYSEVEGLSLLTDRSLYAQSSPCYDLELSVINEIPNRVQVLNDNIYVSSGPARLRRKTSGKWICEGGLLPGAALSVSWREIPSVTRAAAPNVTGSTGSPAAEAPGHPNAPEPPNTPGPAAPEIPAAPGAEAAKNA